MLRILFLLLFCPTLVFAQSVQAVNILNPVKISQNGTDNNVDETNSGAIKTALEIIDDWDDSDRAKIAHRFKRIETNVFSVDGSAIQVIDTDGSTSDGSELTSTCAAFSITNDGDGDLCCAHSASPVISGDNLCDAAMIAPSEKVYFNLGFESATSTVNDIYCIRAAAQTNDNASVVQYGYH